MRSRASRWLGSLVALAVFSFAPLACGDDAPVTVGPTVTPVAGPATAAPSPSASADAQFKAQDAVPDLGPLGYTVQQKGKDPGAGTADVYRALFAKSGGKAALTVLYAFPDAATALDQYGALATALKNPPPDFVGAKATFIDAASPAAGEEHKAYVTQAADGQGNKVWTDIYRFGRVVAIVQLLDDGKTDQLDTRLKIAQLIAAKAR